MDNSSVEFDLRRDLDSLLPASSDAKGIPPAQVMSHQRRSTDAIDDLQRLERCIAHLEARRAELLVEAADPETRIEEFIVESADGFDRRRPRTIQIEDAIREEIAAALRWSPSHAGSLIEEARRLHTDLPATLDALRDGAISRRHASVMVEWSGRLSARHVSGPDAEKAYSRMCAAFEERVLRVARRSTVARTRSTAKRALASLDAAGAQERQQQQRCTRDVTIVDESDGISVLLARMSTPAARAVMEAVAKESTLIDDESLSAGERRAQALTSLVLGATAPQVRLNVVLSAMGEIGSSEASTSGDSLAHLGAAMASGLGNATIDDAEVDEDDLRALLADPAVSVTLRKLLADPVTGVLSGCGRASYRLPDRLREFIIRRDGVCRFPGCGRSARNSQIDHAEAWDDGGSTDPENLGALCTRHHQLKTHGGWEIADSRADGDCTWISPQGRRYHHRPDSIVEITLEQQFAHVVAAALSSADPPGYPPGHPPGHPPGRSLARPPGEGFAQDFIPAPTRAPYIRLRPPASNVVHRREPDPPF